MSLPGIVTEDIYYSNVNNVSKHAFNAPLVVGDACTNYN